jgi:DNA-binding CsgD family transcriptional regulator
MDAPLQADLSERELEILRQVATGASNKEIAAQLFISSNTVKVHLRNIFAKIGAASRTEAAMYAVRIGLVQGVPSTLLPEEASTSYPPVPEQAAAASVEPFPPRRLWPRWLTPVIAILLIGLGGLAFALGRTSSPQTTPAVFNPPAATATAIPRWQVLAPMLTPRQGLALVAFDNQLYAIAGETSQGITGILEVYNPDADTWIALKSKPIPVTEISAALVNGRLYVPGGRVGAAAHEITAQLEIYDPAVDQWYTGASLPHPICAYALQAFEGRLYLFGGWDGTQYLSSVYMYDPALDSWQTRTPMPTARAFSGAASAGGKIYVIGGQAGESPLDVNEIYTPARDGAEGISPWEMGFPIPDARLGFQSITIADTIYVLGGSSQANNSYGLIYIPQSDTWQSIEASPTPLGANFGLSSIGPQLYLVGGEIEAAISDQNLAYQALITLSIPIIIK